MSESYYHWCLHKGLHPWKKVSDFPGYYFATIDNVVAKVGATCSIHGETKAPTDYLMNYIGLQNALMAMIEYPDQCNAIMDYFTENCIAWSLAQLQHGCDAIKVSSPYAGGSFISRKHYLEFVYPYEKKLAQAVTAAGGLIYTHTCGAIGDRLDLIVDTGVSGIECLDPPPLGNVELPDAIAQWSQKIFIKGNVDSVNTLLLKDVQGVREDVRQVLSAGILAPGYIMSTACSVAPAVPKENLQAMVEVVKTYNQSR
jgi:uroporphyrinogen-III decarboxylase